MLSFSCCVPGAVMAPQADHGDVHARSSKRAERDPTVIGLAGACRAEQGPGRDGGRARLEEIAAAGLTGILVHRIMLP